MATGERLSLKTAGCQPAAAGPLAAGVEKRLGGPFYGAWICGPRLRVEEQWAVGAF
jgi:hypothetical protein